MSVGTSSIRMKLNTRISRRSKIETDDTIASPRNHSAKVFMKRILQSRAAESQDIRIFFVENVKLDAGRDLTGLRWPLIMQGVTSLFEPWKNCRDLAVGTPILDCILRAVQERPTRNDKCAVQGSLYREVSRRNIAGRSGSDDPAADQEAEQDYTFAE